MKPQKTARFKTLSYLIWCKGQETGWAEAPGEILGFLLAYTGWDIALVEVNSIIHDNGWAKRFPTRAKTGYDKMVPAHYGDSILHGENVLSIKSHYRKQTLSED